MRQTKKAIQVTTQTDLILCNMCGERVEPHKYHDNYLSVRKTWGYGSAHDGETHAFELCERCYDELVAQFKIKVEG